MTSANRDRRWELGLGLLALVLLAYSTMFTGVTAPNERSRIYLAVALIDDHSLAIDGPAKHFGTILDAARNGTHLYSDKAPGSSLLGAVLYGGLRLFSEPTDWTIDELLGLMRHGLMIPIGLVGLYVLRNLLGRCGVLGPARDLTSLGWLLGSSAFHYSTAFYGHQIVAVALLVALSFVDAAERALESSRWRASLYTLGAGAAAGLAGLTEYQGGIPAFLLALYVIVGPLRRSFFALAGFLFAALPFLLALAAYNTVAFGGPLELSYQHLDNAGLQSIHGQGLGGITSPNWGSFAGGVLSLHRGLIPTSPMFLLVVPGLVVLWRSGRRRLATLIAVTSAYFLLFISSSNMWVAGWGFGPRLLVPGMTWAALAVGLGAQRLARSALGEILVRGAVLLGVLYHQAVHAFFQEPPDTANNPLLDIVAPLWDAKVVAPNLGERLFGLTGRASLVPLVVLVALLSVLLLARRLRWRPVWARALVTSLSVTALGPLFLAVWLVGPSGSEASRSYFRHFVEALSMDEPRR